MKTLFKTLFVSGCLFFAFKAFSAMDASVQKDVEARKEKLWKVCQVHPITEEFEKITCKDGNTPVIFYRFGNYRSAIGGIVNK